MSSWRRWQAQGRAGVLRHPQGPQPSLRWREGAASVLCGDTNRGGARIEHLHANCAQDWPLVQVTQDQIVNSQLPVSITPEFGLPVATVVASRVALRHPHRLEA